MNFNFENPTYLEDLENIAQNTSWESLIGKSIAITGVTGLIGSLMVDFLIYLNQHKQANINILTLGRNPDKIRKRFEYNTLLNNLEILKYNLFDSFPSIHTDFIVHCAGNSHPQLFAEDPVGTILGNILGTHSLLKHAVQTGSIVLLLSSGEIYGENTNSPNAMMESFTGDLNLSNSRACYSEGKRAIEAIAQSYISQYEARIKIARPCRIFGPTMTVEDNKASAQFFKRALNNTNIILKSDGTQQFSYIYSADAVSALFTILLNGKNGEAYNVANETCNVMLKDFASAIASMLNVQVQYDIIGEPGGSQIRNAILDNTKLKSLGWTGKYDIFSAVKSTIKILKGEI